MNLVKRALMAALSVGLTLGYWTLRGPEPDTTEHLSKVPEVVWEGGTRVTVEASCSQPGQLHLSFGRRPLDAKEEYPDDQTLDVNVPLEIGDHRYDVQIPNGVHGYVELGIQQPAPGAKAAVRVRVGEQVAAEDAQELSGQLEKGTAFFAQVHMSDYAAGTYD